MPVIEVICLANSWKRGGRCVAGLRTDGGGWVRPVSAELKGVLQYRHYAVGRGKEAALLDVLQISLQCPQPVSHHPEDWLIASGPWKRSSKPSSQEVRTFLQENLAAGPELLGDCHERIAYSVFEHRAAAASLALVKPDTLAWRLGKNSTTGRQSLRAVFALAGADYNLPVTDPVWQKNFAALPAGDYTGENGGKEMLLTISLGEPFGRENCCYKLVAGVVTMPAASRGYSTQNLGELWRTIWDWIWGRAG